jgi:hypothetical protein
MQKKHSQSLQSRKSVMTIIKGSETMSTTRYDEFITDPSKRNRQIDEDRVKQYMSKFESGKYFMEEFPALVRVDEDGQFVIVDGQHRWIACQRTGRPFIFRWQSENSALTMDNIACVQDGSKWSTFDYIRSKKNSTTGRHKQSYILLERVMLKYGIPATTALAVLKAKPNGEPGGGPESTGMKEGTLLITDEQEVNAHEVLEHIEETFKSHPEGMWKQKNFIVAVQRAMRVQGYKKDQMKARAANYASQLMKRQTVKDYLKNLEVLYNYNSRKKLRFDFYQ